MVDRVPSKDGARPLSFAALSLDVRRIQRRLERHAADFEDLSAAIDRVAHGLEQFRRALPPGIVSLPPEPSPCAPAREALRVLEKQAEAGAVIAIEPNPDRSFLVSIDGRKSFHLPPLLGALLEIIVDPTYAAAYATRGGWRSYKEVAQLLRTRTGRTKSVRDVTKAIAKLRRVFEKAGENKFLIQTDRHGAVRFRRRA